MHYVLYEHDHENRAKALAKERQCQLVTDAVKVVPGMRTLTFWGHGTPGFLCGLAPRQAADKIKAWKEANKKISTVEILTCNARHARTGADPYIEQLNHKLGFFLRRSLTIKCMPIRSGPGGVHGDSILFADYKSLTWCYVTTHNERALVFMRNVFKAVCENEFQDDAVKTAVFLTSAPRVPHGAGAATNPFSKFVPSIREMHDSDPIFGLSNQPRFMEDLLKALKDVAFRKEFVLSRKYTMNYGAFETLRTQLVEV